MHRPRENEAPRHAEKIHVQRLLMIALCGTVASRRRAARPSCRGKGGAVGWRRRGNGGAVGTGGGIAGGRDCNASNTTLAPMDA